ncbi:MAG: hypothetical protein Q7J64_01160 [Elusimicrobiota bacterium]|nr:hypothetical protein [Elusimicrobiota bacterium]
MLALARPVSRAALEWSFRLLGAAVIVMAAQEYRAGHLGVHAGELYGRRPAFLPLLPAAGMICLWLVQALAGLALMTARYRTTTLRIAAAVVFFALTQSYFNQKMFLALTLLALSIEPPNSKEAGPSIQAVRAQLLLLYIASAAFKLRDGFGSGESLSAALEQLADRGLTPWVILPLAAAPLLSKLAIAAELALPVALLRVPRLGVAGVVALHFGFAVCLPGIWPYTLTACAAALLFRPPFR